MQQSEPGMQPTKHGLAEFVRALKTFSARKINELRQTYDSAVWQRKSPEIGRGFLGKYFIIKC